MPDVVEIPETPVAQSSDVVQNIGNGSGEEMLEGGDNYVISAAKGSGILTVGKLVEYVGRFVIAFLLARVLGAEEF